MKKIGLIGGLSWVSSAEYYKRINEITQLKAGGVSSARIVLESVNRQDYVSAVIDRGDEAGSKPSFPMRPRNAISTTAFTKNSCKTAFSTQRGPGTSKSSRPCTGAAPTA